MIIGRKMGEAVVANPEGDKGPCGHKAHMRYGADDEDHFLLARDYDRFALGLLRT